MKLFLVKEENESGSDRNIQKSAEAAPIARSTAKLLRSCASQKNAAGDSDTDESDEYNDTFLIGITFLANVWLNDILMQSAEFPAIFPR